MTLLKPQQKTSRYNTISDAIADDGTAAVVHRSLMWMGMIIAFVAGMMVTAGGAVWMQDESSSYTTTAEGLVIATEADPRTRIRCLRRVARSGCRMNHRTQPPPVQVTTAQVCHAVVNHRHGLVNQVATFLLDSNALHQGHYVKDIFGTIYMVTVQRARHPAMHVVREKGTRRDCFPAGTSNGFFDLTYTHFIM